MTQFLDEAGIERLEKYFDKIGDVLGDDRRRASFATYAMGLFGDGERKSMEPIAARATGDPDEIDRVHDRLCRFMIDSPWDDRGVRQVAVNEALTAMTAREPVKAWVVDDTGMMKQGTHSVGVQRQYTGTVGKIANCQLAVSLSITTKTEHLPIDFELYLPKSWTSDNARRAEARIPDEIEFRTKPELAIGMIRRAVDDDLPRGVVLGDSAFGDSSEFRADIRALDLHYAVGIKATTKVWRVDRYGRRHGEAISVKKLAQRLGRKRFRNVTWRDATRGPLWSRFVRLRVVAAHDDGSDPAEREDQWLLIEWPDNESAPAHYTLSSLPRSWSAKQLVRLVKERYRTERVYEDLKGELGFDHYEGRRFTGWHHHVSVALCCFAFIVAERCRAFPPSARRQAYRDPQPIAA
jgi:SRSO17 transposase